VTRYLYELRRSTPNQGRGGGLHNAQPQDAGSREDLICTPLKFPATFSPAACAAIVGLGRSGHEVVAGLAQPVENYRTGSTQAILPDRRSAWLYRKVNSLFGAINQWYRFEIIGLVDALLYCEYPTGTHFHWHLDAGAHPTGTRKISLSIQLSDDFDYAGGALEFAALGELNEARGIGTTIAFPSFLYHRVTTVTAGTRRSLVAWAHGPVFR